VLTLVILFDLLGRFQVRLLHRLVFIIMMLASPLYVFWSRTFMIESTALFFSLAYLDLVLRVGKSRKPSMLRSRVSAALSRGW
jgi:dolichyl-phosphate-mannose--protein O-mannosyl transferase